MLMKIKNISTAFVTAAAIAIASCGTVSAFAEEAEEFDPNKKYTFQITKTNDGTHLYNMDILIK